MEPISASIIAVTGLIFGAVNQEQERIKQEELLNDRSSSFKWFFQNPERDNSSVNLIILIGGLLILVLLLAVIVKKWKA